MENQIVRRRVNIIASHLGTPEDLSVSATHLFPMSCSNSLNSVIRRCDSKMYFARQTSPQACFMRQVSNEQNCSNSLNSVIRRCDSKVYFARQTSPQACFMRQVSNEQGSYAQSTTCSKSSGRANQGPYVSEAPMFSRTSTAEPSAHNVGELQWLQQAYNFYQPVPDPPTFGRPGRIDHRYHSKERTRTSKLKEFERLPKMDIAESGLNYVITIELPGVNANSIRVEVKNQNLRVTGYRSIDWRKAANFSVDTYHRKEISQGPNEIVWPLPTNVKKDSISAEFVEGLLLIKISKLSEACRQLKKAYM